MSQPLKHQTRGHAMRRLHQPPLRLLAAAAILLAAPPAGANAAAWFAPDSGCGSERVFERTQRIADLPGCSARLALNAPEVERALRAMKRALLIATARLDNGLSDQVEPLLEEAEHRLAETPPPHPELPARWSDARPLYRQAIDRLRRRAAVTAHLGPARLAWREAVRARPGIRSRERDGGPEAALGWSTACVGALEQLDPAEPIELEVGRVRPIWEWLADCRAIRDEAWAQSEAQRISVAAHRKASRRAQRAKTAGDRP
jgi:hypothetical protein